MVREGVACETSTQEGPLRPTRCNLKPSHSWEYLTEWVYLAHSHPVEESCFDTYLRTCEANNNS